MAEFKLSEYVPGGPTLARFHASAKFHRLLAGPIGSSKTTTAAVAEPFITAMMQRPDANGVRSAEVGVLRDTYRNLYATLIPTWLYWVPREVGNFTGSDDRPAAHVLSFPAPHLDRNGQPDPSRQGMCRLSVQFRALGANSVEAVCRGWELHGAYLDEEDLMPAEARAFLGGRVLRGGDVRFRHSRGVWGSFNKPDVDHPLYTTCVEELPDGYEFFDQPGGLLPGGPPYVTNPDAENLHNLSKDYYVISATGQPEWYIRRMIRNQWGASYAGDPVYLFDTGRHMAPVELEPADGDELILGLDAGGTPAAVFLGRTATGRRVCYGEVVLVDPSDPRRQRLAIGVGPKRFAEAIHDAIHPRFRQCRITMGYGDPSAFYSADREAGEYSWMEKVGLELGIAIMPAPSNEIALRLDAVRGLLGRDNRYDGRPDLLINPSCRFVRRGFVSDYKWDARDPKQAGKVLKPQKTATSHVHDALQYACLGDQGRAGVQAGPKFDRHQPAAAPSDPGSVGGQGLWREHEVRVAQREREQGRGDRYDSGFNVWNS